MKLNVTKFKEILRSKESEDAAIEVMCDRLIRQFTNKLEDNDTVHDLNLFLEKGFRCDDAVSYEIAYRLSKEETDYFYNNELMLFINGRIILTTNETLDLSISRTKIESIYKNILVTANDRFTYHICSDNDSIKLTLTKEPHEDDAGNFYTEYVEESDEFVNRYCINGKITILM